MLALADGREIPVDAKGAVLGREPVAAPSRAAASLVRITEAGQTLSRSHALFDVAGGVLGVTDLGSANGSVLIRPGADEIDLVPQERIVVAAGDTVELGTFPVRILLR